MEEIIFNINFILMSLLEVKIADKYLSWGNIKNKKIVPFGIIKNLKKNHKYWR